MKRISTWHPSNFRPFCKPCFIEQACTRCAGCQGWDKVADYPAMSFFFVNINQLSWARGKLQKKGKHGIYIEYVHTEKIIFSFIQPSKKFIKFVTRPITEIDLSPGTRPITDNDSYNNNNRPITDKAMKALDQSWHVSCFVCKVEHTFNFFSSASSEHHHLNHFWSSYDHHHHHHCHHHHHLSQECGVSFEGKKNFYCVEGDPVCGSCLGAKE